MLALIVLVFVWMRPLNSPWHPFIAGDGLGYYSYLPATFIYGDRDYRFAWFNAVHDSNYIYSAFPDPSDNLLVEHGGRKINKYYQGCAFLWMPFFFAGHALASPLGFRADGFSLPYQLAIGLASLFYLLTGLVFLRKLLRRRYGEWPALVSVAGAFFGTFLFTYAVFANTLSHVYSFTFITMFLYYADRYFNVRSDLHSLLAAFACLCITVCIRPFNGLIVLALPAFMSGWKIPLPSRRLTPVPVSWLLLAAAALAWTLVINYRQTGRLFAYNYGDEGFRFHDPKFLSALISYHQGLFVYVPLAFVAFFGLLFMNARMRTGTGGLFLLIVFLYSCWWYWPITRRALIDYHALPMMMLAALLSGAWPSINGRRTLLLLVALSIGYFQLKAFQLRRGILDENATYGEIFWRHFFRTEKANIYPIPPRTILKRESHSRDFESGPGILSAEISRSGTRSLVLDSVNYIQRVMESPVPAFFSDKGFRKVRFSFDGYFLKGTSSVHVFIQFFDARDSLLSEAPFYLNAEDIVPGKWDRKEFGIELPDEAWSGDVAKAAFTVWNVEGRSRMFIDDARAEFVLTDRSFETIR